MDRMKVLEMWHRRGPDEVRTVAIWTAGDLAVTMEKYRLDLKPGGLFAHVSDALGYEPIPTRAVLRRGSLRGRIIERYASVDIEEVA